MPRFGNAHRSQTIKGSRALLPVYTVAIVWPGATARSYPIPNNAESQEQFRCQ